MAKKVGRYSPVESEHAILAGSLSIVTLSTVVLSVFVSDLGLLAKQVRFMKRNLGIKTVNKDLDESDDDDDLDDGESRPSTKGSGSRLSLVKRNNKVDVLYCEP